jgi:hypothetical protein
LINRSPTLWETIASAVAWSIVVEAAIDAAAA